MFLKDDNIRNKTNAIADNMKLMILPETMLEFKYSRVHNIQEKKPQSSRSPPSEQT